MQNKFIYDKTLNSFKLIVISKMAHFFKGTNVKSDKKHHINYITHQYVDSILTFH